MSSATPPLGASQAQVDLVTFVARASDGLILSETWDSGQSDTLSVYKQQAKKILTKTKNGPSKCSVDGGTASNPIIFHYMVDSGICYLTLGGKSFPKRLAFAFLDEIHKLFLEELKKHYGTGSVDYRSQIETIQKPYFFITFDRTVQRKRAEFRDPNSTSAIAKLNEGLAEVNNIVRKSLEEMVARGDALEDVSGRANTLRDEAKKFEKGAKYLNWQAMVRKYGMLGTVGFFIFLILYIKIFW
jgi:vesicle transport protein SEC22